MPRGRVPSAEKVEIKRPRERTCDRDGHNFYPWSRYCTRCGWIDYDFKKESK